ncbi:MAG: hypothetical protein AAF432_09355 [Planctomycetota bacterium]
MKIQLASMALLVPMLGAPALAADLAVEQLAPESTVLVVGATNVQKTMDSIKRTPLWDLWMSDELAEDRDEIIKDFTEGIEEMADEIGIDQDTIQMPTGPGGFALYTGTDADLGTPYLAVLAGLDYGEHADKTQELLEAAFAKADDEEPDFEYETGDLNGHTMWTIQLPEEDDADDFDDDFGMPPGMPDPSDLWGDVGEIYLVRCNNVFLFGTEMPGITNAVSTLDGDAGGSVADRGDFQSIKGMMGNSPDMYAVVMTKNLPKVVSTFDTMGMMGMAMPPVKALFGDIGGFGMSMQVDGPDAMMQGTQVVYMPNGKEGLPGLFDTSSGIGELPGFVSADTVSYSRMNVQFDKVDDVILSVINSTPLLKMQMPPDAIDEITGVVRAVCGPLGNEVHIVQTARKPYTADNMAQFMAMECPDPESFENAMNELAAQAGMEPRDFLGHRIYAMDMAGMNPMGGGMESVAIGIGGQTVFMGPAESVENGLRSIGQDDAGGLAANAKFSRAMNVINVDEVVGWGYSDLPNMMEASFAQQMAIQQATIDEYREFDPELADEMEQEIRDSMAGIEDIDWDFVGGYIGASVWVAQSTNQGYVIKTFVLEGDRDVE